LARCDLRLNASLLPQFPANAAYIYYMQQKI
jgi:hypothetical protein